jgi:ribosome maturation factor RimP
MRGQFVPSFYKFMQVKNIINQTIREVIEERPDLFIVNQDISESLDIRITVDGDKLVNISDCIAISRKIENALDRDQYDFSIKVQSPGADEPLQVPRQYHKHVGRTLKLKTATEKIEGKLVEVKDNHIKLTWKSREKKPRGKGKITVKYDKTIPFNAIEKANIKLTFNKN